MRLGRRFHRADPGRHAERRLWRAAALRREREDIVPFFVLPPKGEARAPSPTSPHLHLSGLCQSPARQFHDELPRRGRPPGAPSAEPQPSTRTTASRPTTRIAMAAASAIRAALRPILTMRPGFLTFHDPRGSGLRHLPADSHLTDWLEEKGIAFDVITDEDLDDEGLPLLARYKCVVTGSHPEYHTPGTLDALQAYVEAAAGWPISAATASTGRWRAAPDRPMCSRCAAPRAASAPGRPSRANTTTQLDGSYGGLWRRNGRPPQMLCGVGFCGQGAFEGTLLPPHARRRRPARRLDLRRRRGRDVRRLRACRAAARRASSSTAPTRARHAAERRDPGPVGRRTRTISWWCTRRCWATSPPSPASGRRTLIRAEIVYFETRNGGAVFSAGSITFCGSLSHANYANPISRMLENVLTRFQA